MLTESLQQTVCLMARNCLAENVLLNGVRPLSHMQRRHPQRRARDELALSMSGVLIGEIE